jgi:cyclase
VAVTADKAFMTKDNKAELNIAFLHRRQLFMALFRSCTYLVFILALSLVGHADSLNFVTIPVAKDVYAVIARPGMLANWGRCNATFIVNQNDVVVVDTQMRPSWAYEVIAEIRKVTDKPVRYVINTHWHRDHVQGNQAYLEAFGPGVAIIQQEFAREDQIKNQPYELKIRAPAELSRTEQLIAADKDEKGNTLDAAGRSRLKELLAAQKAYLSEVPNIRITPGTLTFSKKLVLYEGNREICLYYFGRAHTRGDTVVYLPAEKVVITGDISQAGVPDTRHSYPVEWLGALESLRALDWTVNIPGHGNVQNGREALNGFISYMNDLVSDVKTAFAKNLTVEQTIKFVDLKKYSAMRDYNENNETAVRRTYEELSGRD